MKRQREAAEGALAGVHATPTVSTTPASSRAEELNRAYGFAADLTTAARHEDVRRLLIPLKFGDASLAELVAPHPHASGGGTRTEDDLDKLTRDLTLREADLPGIIVREDPQSIDWPENFALTPNIRLLNHSTIPQSSADFAGRDLLEHMFNVAAIEEHATKEYVIRHEPFEQSKPRPAERVEHLQDSFSYLLARDSTAVPIISDAVRKWYAAAETSNSRRPGASGDLAGMDSKFFRDLRPFIQSAAPVNSKPTTEAEQQRKRSVERIVRMLQSADAACTVWGMRNNCWLNEKHATFGRYFTDRRVLDLLAAMLRCFMDPGSDTYVDFSAGNNEFGLALGCKRWFGVDIYPPDTHAAACALHFKMKNWFAVRNLPEHYVLGLNPPFGVEGQTASQFVSHAFTMTNQPRVIALIVPERTAIVAQMIADSNKFLRALKQARGSRPDLAAVDAQYPRLIDYYTQSNPAFAGQLPTKYADISTRCSKHPALQLQLPYHVHKPKYCLVLEDLSVCGSNDFYFPGSVAWEGRAGGHAASSSGSSATASGQSKAGAGAGAGAASSTSSGSQAARGITIRPNDPSAFYVFVRFDAIMHPDDIVEGHSHKDQKQQQQYYR